MINPIRTRDTYKHIKFLVTFSETEKIGAQRSDAIVEIMKKTLWNKIRDKAQKEERIRINSPMMSRCKVLVQYYIYTYVKRTSKQLIH